MPSNVYTRVNVSTIVLEPSVGSTGAIDIELTTGTNQTLAAGDIVIADSDPAVIGGSTVTIEVQDSRTHDFYVYELDSGPDWTRLPSGSPTRSEKSVSIPATVGDIETIAAMIEARDSTGGVVAGPRSQVIIIKRRPPQ